MDVAIVVLHSQRLAMFPGIVKVTSMDNDFGAQIPHGFNLGRVGALGDANPRLHAKELSSVGNGLAVIAGRGSNHSTLALLFRELAGQIDSTSNLKGSGRQVVFVLHPKAATR